MDKDSFPEWLFQSVITGSDVKSVLSRLRNMGTTRSWNQCCNRFVSCLDDISQYASEVLVKEIGFRMKNCCDCMSKFFLGFVGYLMLDWTKYTVVVRGKVVNLSRCSLKMVMSDDEIIPALSVRSIKLATVQSLTVTPDEARRRDQTYLYELRNRFEYMYMEVEHMVLDENGQGLVSRRRRLYFFHIAIRVLSNFSMVDNIHCLLMEHECSFRSITSLAVVFHNIMLKFVQRFESGSVLEETSLSGLSIG